MSTYGLRIVSTRYISTFEKGERNCLKLLVRFAKSRESSPTLSGASKEVHFEAVCVRLDSERDWARLDSLTCYEAGSAPKGHWCLAFDKWGSEDMDMTAAKRLLELSTVYLDAQYCLHLGSSLFSKAQEIARLDYDLVYLMKPWVGIDNPEHSGVKGLREETPIWQFLSKDLE